VQHFPLRTYNCTFTIIRFKVIQPLVLPVVGIEVIIAATVFQSPVDHAEITQNAGIIYSAPLIYVLPPLTLLIAKIRGLPKIERSKGK